MCDETLERARRDIEIFRRPLTLGGRTKIALRRDRPRLACTRAQPVRRTAASLADDVTATRIEVRRASRRRLLAARTAGLEPWTPASPCELRELKAHRRAFLRKLASVEHREQRHGVVERVRVGYRVRRELAHELEHRPGYGHARQVTE